MVVPHEGIDVPKRSPGVFGLGPNTPPIREDTAFSPTLEQPHAQRAYPQVGANNTMATAGGGVTRKKSLMQKIKTMVRQRSQSIEDGGLSGSGSGGPNRGQLVVSGPMAGQLVSPGGLSDSGRVEEGDEEEYTTRGRRGSEDDEFFGGMSPDREKAGPSPAGRRGGTGYGQRL